MKARISAHHSIDFGRDFLFEIETGKNLQKLLVVTDRYIVEPRQIDDFFRKVAAPFGDEFWRKVLFCRVAQRDGLSMFVLIHTVTLRRRMSEGTPKARAVNLISRSRAISRSGLALSNMFSKPNACNDSRSCGSSMRSRVKDDSTST